MERTPESILKRVGRNTPQTQRVFSGGCVARAAAQQGLSAWERKIK